MNINQVFKSNALLGNQTIVPFDFAQDRHVINIVGQRTVVLLNPSFKNFVIPDAVISTRLPVAFTISEAFSY